MRKYFGTQATDTSLSYKWNSQIVIQPPPVKMYNAWFDTVSLPVQECSGFQYTRRLELTYSKFSLRKYQERGFGLKALEVQYTSEMRQENVKDQWLVHNDVTVEAGQKGCNHLLYSFSRRLYISCFPYPALEIHFPNISRAPTVIYTCTCTKQSNAHMAFKWLDTLGMEEFPTRIHLWA